MTDEAKPMTDKTIEAAAQAEAERLLPLFDDRPYHLRVGEFNAWLLIVRPAVAAYIEGLMKRIAFLTNGEAEKQMAQALGVDDERTTWTMVGLQQIARHRQQQLADAQREIERLKAAAWATLTIADMTVPQIVAMKQENAALRRALAELEAEDPRISAESAHRWDVARSRARAALE